MMDLFEIYRPRLNDVIEIINNGKRFRCVGFGKDYVDDIYSEVFIYRQYNTEDVPLQFMITHIKYFEAMNIGKIKWIK